MASSLSMRANRLSEISKMRKNLNDNMGTPYGPLNEEDVAIQLAKFVKDYDEREALLGSSEVATIEAERKKAEAAVAAADQPAAPAQPPTLTQEQIEALKALWQLEPWRKHVQMEQAFAHLNTNVVALHNVIRSAGFSLIRAGQDARGGRGGGRGAGRGRGGHNEIGQQVSN